VSDTNRIINGIDLNYYDRGSGCGVLFLHGWGSDFSSFLSFLDRVSECGLGYRACALDLPGFGKSAEPPCVWGVDDYADFTLDFLAELNIKSAVLIGHSFGGRIAIKLAARKDLPIVIPKIILVDSAGIRRNKNAKQTARALLYKVVKRFVSIEAVQKNYPNLLEKLRNKMGSEDYRNASPRMRECLVKTINEDLTHCLAAISCPALLIWGENDAATPLADAEVMEKLIPDAGLVVLKNAGHYSFLDQSHVFGRVLDSFLEIRRR
jgi:pimeloyl-ACP methyl ester carboxylesterase